MIKENLVRSSGLFDEQHMGSFLEALEFAALKHRLQMRKDGSSPYINHLIAVASLLWFEGGIRAPELLLAALLHDTLEDTETRVSELEEKFGAEVCALVQEVTDDKSLSKARRKQLLVEMAGRMSPGARQLLLADKCSNMKDLLKAVPLGWSRTRVREYFLWGQELLEQLRGTNAGLEGAYRRTLEEGLRKF